MEELPENFEDLKDLGLRNYVVLMTLIAMLVDLKLFTTSDIAKNTDAVYKSQIRPLILKDLKNEKR